MGHNFSLLFVVQELCGNILQTVSLIKVTFLLRPSIFVLHLLCLSTLSSVFIELSDSVFSTKYSRRWFGLVVTVGLDRHTYSRSGQFSTGMSDICGFGLRPHHLGT